MSKYIKILYLLTIITRCLASTNTNNQVILLPTTLNDVAKENTYDEAEQLQDDLYVSGDLLCNSKGCYPLIFEPETNWKEVKPEQRLPGGLDIRLNLETGKKEAKLVENSGMKQQQGYKDNKENMAESSEYEFTAQFKEVQQMLDSGLKDYSQVESILDDLVEFAHDYKHGFKIISHEFALLKDLSFNETLPISLREVSTRIITSGLRNNPPVLTFIKTNYPDYINQIFNKISQEVNNKKISDNKKILVRRYVSILNELIEQDDAAVSIDLDVLQKMYKINDKQVQIKTLELASKIFAPENQNDSILLKRGNTQLSEDRIQEWVNEYSKLIQDNGIDELHLRKFFLSLYNIKKQYGASIKVDASFLNWLIDQIEIRKAHLNDGLEERDTEQDTFDEKFISSRHIIFGNPLAEGIKRFNDEL